MTFNLEDFKERVLGFEKNFVRFVIDPLHGQIGLTELEDKVVRTKAFMRLKKIQQLGFASNIYPGATHKRYEHCLGTMHITWTMLKRLLKNYASIPHHWYNENVLAFFSDHVLESTRLAALLHDLGHGPFSHSFEQVAKNMGQKVDHDKITNYLLTFKFPKNGTRELFQDQEILKALENSDEVRLFRKELKIVPRKTRETIVGIYNKNYIMRLFNPEGFNSIRLFLNNILKGDIGSDRVDYLLRDTYFSGLGHRFNFTDLLENLRGMYDEESDRLLLAIDSNGRSIVEFFMMTRYYHYKLIAHHPRNVFEEIVFQERVKRSKESAKRNYFFDMSMRDDYIEGELPSFQKQMDMVGVWNMGTIGVDHYRFFFYRIASDPVLKKEYARRIKENIVRGVHQRGNSEIENSDLFIAFVVEKPHIPLLQDYRWKYLIEKDDAFEKYSVLHHDHSILIRGLARTYLEDTSLIIFSGKDFTQQVAKFVQSTHHFYLDPDLFEDLISGISTLDASKYDFLLYALYVITEGGLKPFNKGITELYKQIHNLQQRWNLDFYDFKTKDYFDPDSGSFSYPKATGKEESLIDDLFLFDAAGLIEIKVHLKNRKYAGKDSYQDSYFLIPIKRHDHLGPIHNI